MASAANRDAAQELLQRARELERQGGDQRRVVQMIERAAAMCPDREIQQELSDARMRYARTRDARNNATPPPPLQPPSWLRSRLERVVGPQRVDAVIGMCIILVLLAMLRILGGGRALWNYSLGALPGDINWRSGTSSVHFPIVSSILFSLGISVLLRMFNNTNTQQNAAP
eukprot:CAMPEP_0172001530 /NCGR_PEP_ID=MMETSP1041-20130122/2923_1 /TAXON_ID=464988 /ORGANISM="Hemiselmis andersenii, Strain CCMP439" /LENGTH=170 /DNA_ID=CAMNT_0012655185 /DNA_START=123 /DNA_END=631 /DNA_ORIENTATION=+